MNKTSNIWVVDDDRSIRWVLERALTKHGYNCTVFESGESLLRKIQHQAPDVIISDVRMDGMDGLQLLKRVQTEQPDIPVIIMTAHSDLDSAVASFQGGAFEYLPKPFDVDEALSLVERAIEHRAKHQPAEEVHKSSTQTEIIGEAPAMQEVFRAIGRLSPEQYYRTY